MLFLKQLIEQHGNFPTLVFLTNHCPSAAAVLANSQLHDGRVIVISM